jgi:hypothetical protein
MFCMPVYPADINFFRLCIFSDMRNNFCFDFFCKKGVTFFCFPYCMDPDFRVRPKLCVFRAKARVLLIVNA